MSLSRVEARAAIRQQLKDPDSDTALWTDADIDGAIDRALRDINRREPKLEHSLLAIQDLSKSIDLSSLDNLIDVISVEWPFGEVPAALRNFRLIGNTLIMELSSVVDTTASTLTGTITFTNGSFAVSGSGTAFTTELVAGYYIKKSSGTHWYRIAYVSSNTALVLDSLFEETTGADTVSVTAYRTSNGCAMVTWTSPYTLAPTEGDLPQKVEDLVILGAVTHCLSAQATYKADTVPIGVATVATYAGQADRAMAFYQRGLDGLGRPEDDITASYPIT